MRKSKFYEEDGILYATLRGFAEYLGVKEHTLWYYRRMGALIKVRTDKGLYFRVSDGWEIRSSRMLYKVGEDEPVKVPKRERQERLEVRDYMNVYSAREIMEMEGIDEQEFCKRLTLRLYIRSSRGWGFLTDQQWNRMSKKKQQEWSHVRHGSKLAFKDISEYEEKLDRICGL